MDAKTIGKYVAAIIIAATPAVALAQGNSDATNARPRFLPDDATLVGAAEGTEVRTFPEQLGPRAGNNAAQVQKEEVQNVGAIDRVWTTKSSYQDSVKAVDQKLASAGDKQLAKTTTSCSTAWNLRTPDGHIANVIVRNTQPTTIETEQIAEHTSTVPR